MDNIQLIMGLRALADIIEYYEKEQATKEGIARAVDKHFTREFKRIEKLEDDFARKQILQENVNLRIDRERERASEVSAASTPTRKKRQRKKSMLRKIRVWIKRKRYAFRKLTRRRRGHAQRTRGSVPAVRKGAGGSV